MNPAIKDKVHEMLNSCVFCVISSVNDQGNAEAAMVGFSHNYKMELFIGTSKKSRKFANIARNPKVAVVFGPYDNSTVQYEGQASLMEDADALQPRLEQHFKKLPFAKKFLEDPDQVWFEIKPEWLRLTSRGKQNITEETRQFS